MKNEIKFSLKPFLLFAGLVLIIFGIISLLFSGKFWGWLLMFPYLGNKIQDWTGINYWISRAISIPITLIGVFYLPWLFSWKKDKRTRSLIVLTAVSSMFCVGMSLIYDDRNFDPSGKAFKCVARNIWGQWEEQDCRNVVHENFGTKVFPITPAIAREMKLAKSSPPPIKRVVPDENYRLFSADGKPLLWYYKHPNEKLEFFAEPGMHPSKNFALAPINTAVAQLFYKYLANGKTDMIIVNNKHHSQSISNQSSAVSDSLSKLSKLNEVLKNLR